MLEVPSLILGLLMPKVPRRGRRKRLTGLRTRVKLRPRGELRHQTAVSFSRVAANLCARFCRAKKTGKAAADAGKGAGKSAKGAADAGKAAADAGKGAAKGAKKAAAGAADAGKGAAKGAKKAADGAAGAGKGAAKAAAAPAKKK